MAQVRVLVLRAAGINCDGETAHAWERAGALPELVHVRQLSEAPERLRDYPIVTIPGGFSYGDDLAAGRVLAARLVRGLEDELRANLDRGRLLLGICNGFQVLVQAGLLPGAPATGGPRRTTVTGNRPPGFQARWVTLNARATNCVFLSPGETFELPIAHGEGRVLFADQAEQERLESAGQLALVYAGDNPNGSAGDVAGLCDQTGRVFGLMPHPERYVVGTQHPCWTSRAARADGDGLAIFRRAVAAMR